MGIQIKVIPSTVLKFATQAAVVGLAASSRQLAGNQANFDNLAQSRALLQAGQAGVPPQTDGLTPPTPVASSPPPPNVPQAVPPANPAAPQGPGVATPPGTTPVPTTQPGGHTPDVTCTFGHLPGVHQYSLGCFEACLDFFAPADQHLCTQELAVVPGPNPHDDLVWCPFVIDIENRLYVTAKDCSDNCYSADENGIQIATYGFNGPGYLPVCQNYEALVPANQPSNPTGITGTITMVQNTAVCLDTMSGSNANGTTVNVFHCDGGQSQQWTLTPFATLVSGGRCLDIIGGNVTAGAFLEIADCNGADSQQWGDYLGQIMHGRSGSNMCLDTLGGLTYDYISAVVNPCDTTKLSQTWVAA